MIIKRLELYGVCPIDTLSLDMLPSGVTAIVGPNESGKTTIVTSIVAIIFGLNNDVQIHPTRNNNVEFRGLLYFNQNDMDFIIERDFYTNQTRLIKIYKKKEEVLFEGNANPRGRSEEPRLYRNLIKSELGLPPANVIMNSSIVNQIDISVEVNEELRRQISGAGQGDYKKAIKQLKNNYYHITRLPLPEERARQKDRKIQLLESEINQFLHQYQEAKKLTEELSIKNAEFNESFNKLVQTKKILLNKRNETDALDEYHNLLDKYEYLHEQKQLQEKTEAKISKLEEIIKLHQIELNKKKYEVYQNFTQDELDSLSKYIQSDAESTWNDLQIAKNKKILLKQKIEKPEFEFFKSLTKEELYLVRKYTQSDADTTWKKLQNARDKKKEIKQELEESKFNFFRGLSTLEFNLIRKYVNSDAKSTWKDIRIAQDEKDNLNNELADPRFDQFLTASDDSGNYLEALRTSKRDLVEVEEILRSKEEQKKSFPRWLIWIIPFVGATAAFFLGYLLGKNVQILNIITGTKNSGIISGVILAIVVLFLGSFFAFRSEINSRSLDKKKIEAKAKERDLKEEINDLQNKLGSIYLQIKNGLSIELMIGNWSQWVTLKENLKTIENKIKLLKKREALEIINNPKFSDIIDESGTDGFNTLIKNWDRWDVLQDKRCGIENEIELYESMEALEILKSNKFVELIDQGGADALNSIIHYWKQWDILTNKIKEVEKHIDLLESRETVNIRQNPKISSIIDKYGIEQIKNSLNEFNNLKSEIKSTKKGLRSIKSPSDEFEFNIQRIDRNLTDVILQLSSIEDRYPTLELLKENNEKRLRKLQEFKNETNQLNNALETLERTKEEKNQELILLRASNIKEPNILAEDIEEKQEDLDRLIDHAESLKIAYTILTEAITEYEESHLDRLSDATSKMFYQFTQGKYSKVEVLSDGTVSVFPVDGSPFDSEFLSAGALDQLYLSIRIAVTDLISSDIKLPYIFDDSFVNFDNERLNQALKSLKDISQDRQVILLSHDHKYKSFGDKVIELSA